MHQLLYYAVYDFRERPVKSGTETLSELVRGKTSTIGCPGADGGRRFREVKAGDESTGCVRRRYDHNTGPFTLGVPFTGNGLDYIVLSWDIYIVLSGGWPDWMVCLIGIGRL